MLTAVIITLREVLEAALLISILSAMSVALAISRRWIFWSLGIGLLGSLLLGSSVATITGAFDGVGQEVVSALMQIIIYLLLTIFVVRLQTTTNARHRNDRLLQVTMSGVVALSTTREGFEILVYVIGFTHDLEYLLNILTGMMVGTGIGVSIGALIYYLLSSMQDSMIRITGSLLLILIAGSVLSQASLLLIQADWLPSQLPLWDSSWLISEHSVPGQLLYALLGYEATPTLIQAGCYLGGVLLLLALALVAHWYSRSGDDADAD